MFVKFFTFVIIVIPVTTELVPYIHTCGRKNPYLDSCVKHSVEDLREKICMGIPELEAPPLESFVIDNMTIYDTNDAKLFLKDSNMLGLCNFVLNTIHVELEKPQITFTLTFPKVYVNSTYDIAIRILVLIAHKGPIYFSLDNVLVKYALDLKIITRYGEKYVYATKINLHLEFKKLEIKLDANEPAQINEIISTFLSDNKEELIAQIKPSLETEISKKLLLITNNILKHFTFDDLFPDRD